MNTSAKMNEDIYHTDCPADAVRRDDQQLEGLMNKNLQAFFFIAGLLSIILAMGTIENSNLFGTPWDWKLCLLLAGAGIVMAVCSLIISEMDEKDV